MNYLLKNGLILENEKLIKKDVYINNGLITFNKLNEYEEIDCNNLLIIPGACDMHVHLREPGFTEKETIYTASMSALKGGVTTLCAMPNVIPYPDNLENLEYINSLIKEKALVNIYQLACITEGEKSLKLSDIDNLSKHVLGFSDDGVGIDDMNLLKEACLKVKENNNMIISHAEVKEKKFTREGEFEAVKREIEVIKKTNVRYHFCHISTKESVSLIKEASKYNNITFEVTPHHLFLNNLDIKNGNYKMNPPLMTKLDNEVLIEAIKNLDKVCISTDHAPHQKCEKEVSYDKALNGIIGLETMIPLIYTKLVKTNRLSLSKMIELISYNPRKFLGLDLIKIDEGNIADITILDINNYHIYSEDEILSKGKNSPFIGENLTGYPKYTFVRGNLLYKGE